LGSKRAGLLGLHRNSFIRINGIKILLGRNIGTAGRNIRTTAVWFERNERRSINRVSVLRTTVGNVTIAVSAVAVAASVHGHCPLLLVINLTLFDNFVLHGLSFVFHRDSLKASLFLGDDFIIHAVRCVMSVGVFLVNLVSGGTVLSGSGSRLRHIFRTMFHNVQHSIFFHDLLHGNSVTCVDIFLHNMLLDMLLLFFFLSHL
jgi:hypothetical protein